MKILITGGLGFIGSHLSELLLTKGNQVVVIDDLSSGSLSNISSVTSDKNFTLIQGSILDVDLVKDTMAKVDKCFHLAATLGVSNILKDPITALEVNLKGSEIVLGQAVDFKIRTVLTSTSEIYGKNPVMPLFEDSDRVLGSPKISRWTYSEAKALDEFMAFHLNKSRNFPVTIARLFNTVGPRQVGKYGMVLPRFIDSALKNEPLTVYGDGSQTRTFCSVGEVVDALSLLSEQDQTIGEVYNVGSADEISIIDLAQKVISKLNSSSEILFKSFSENFGEEFEEASSRVPSIAKIQSAIGWQSTKGIDEIIDDIVLSKSI